MSQIGLSPFEIKGDLEYKNSKFKRIYFFDSSFKKRMNTNYKVKYNINFNLEVE